MKINKQKREKPPAQDDDDTFKEHVKRVLRELFLSQPPVYHDYYMGPVYDPNWERQC